jgi:hypothetical protein
MADLDKTAPQAGVELPDPQPDTDSSGTRLNRDQLKRLAGLVVNDEITAAFAMRNLSPDDCQQLESLVRELNRVRLVRFIATQIAWDIHRDSAQTTECEL